MASLKGLAMWAIANQLAGDALVVNVGGVNRCMTAEMAPTRLSGSTPVPQIRFICDGFCGIVAKKPSKQCRGVDRNPQLVAAANPNPPPGLVRATQVRVQIPYHTGEGASGAAGLPALTGP